MKYILISLSFLLAAIFLSLECIILLFAINNHHYAYYYAGFAAGSTVFLFIGRYLREKNKGTISRVGYNIHIILQILTILTLMLGAIVLVINGYLRTI